MKKWFLALLCLLLLSCDDQVCRHKVMSHYAVAIEKHLPVRIVVYRVNLPFWMPGEAHAQVQVQRDGKWLYLQEFLGYLSETDTPEYPLDGWVIYFTGEEFLKMLDDGHYHYPLEGASR